MRSGRGWLFYCALSRVEPSIAITRYDADLGGWLDYADDEISHWQTLPPPPTE